MTNKTKKRARVLQRETGASFQTALRAVREHRPVATVSDHGAPDLRCDFCGQPVVPDVDGAMVQWYSTPESGGVSHDDVAALFLNHKGACDEVLREIGSRLGFRNAWDELYCWTDTEWVRYAIKVWERRNFAEAHEDRLYALIRSIQFAREGGWRPITRSREAWEKSRTDHDRHLREIEQAKVLNESVQDVATRVAECFVPEGLPKQFGRSLNALGEDLASDLWWAEPLLRYPEISKRSNADEFDVGTIGFALRREPFTVD